jgi:hypothetical protein
MNYWQLNVGHFTTRYAVFVALSIHSILAGIGLGSENDSSSMVRTTSSYGGMNKQKTSIYALI